MKSSLGFIAASLLVVGVASYSGSCEKKFPSEAREDTPPPRRLAGTNRMVMHENGGEVDEDRIKRKLREPHEGAKPSTPVATTVPGRPGFVFSPYNNKMIDVKGIPAGTVVADPTYPAEEKRFFRVSDIPTARPVPGKQGFVFSPYTNKIISVKGIEPGSTIDDPTFSLPNPEGEDIPQPFVVPDARTKRE